MNNLKKPYVFFRALIKREMNHASVAPTQALLFMTYRCTSHCKMCTIWKRGLKVDPKEELSLEDWKKIVDKLHNYNIQVLEIFGGDSLLRKDVTIPLIEYIKKKNKKTAVELPTNCNLLDKDTAFALVKSGIDKIYISLDGPIEIHDKIRGKKGTYTNVQSAVENLVKAKKELKNEKPAVVINCTISKNNVDNFEQVIPVAKKLEADAIELEYVGEFKKENIENTSLNGIKPAPFYITSSASNLLNKEQAQLLKKKMQSVKQLAKKMEVKLSTSVIDSLTIDDLVNGTVPNLKCYISRYLVTVDPYGNVFGCFHYNNYIIGNLKTDSLSSIRNGSRYHSFLDAQKKGKFKICQNCISGVNRNSNFMQTIHRNTRFILKKKGFDET